MRRINSFFIISYSILGVLGCKINGTATRTVNEGREVNGLRENAGFRYIKGKGNLIYGHGERNINLGIRTRSTMDSATWISLSLLGMEAFRVIIDKDSVRVLDRIAKKYHTESLDTLENFIGLPLGYNQFEIILFGIPVSADAYEEMDAALKMGFKAETDTIEQSVRLRGLSLLSHDGRELLTTEYGKHVKRGRICLPRTAKFVRSNSDSVRVEIEWTELDTSPQIEMPFHIPTGYERIR